jgi:hypothetical protein
MTQSGGRELGVAVWHILGFYYLLMFSFLENALKWCKTFFELCFKTLHDRKATT